MKRLLWWLVYPVFRVHQLWHQLSHEHKQWTPPNAGNDYRILTCWPSYLPKKFVKAKVWFAYTEAGQPVEHVRIQSIEHLTAISDAPNFAHARYLAYHPEDVNV